MSFSDLGLSDKVLAAVTSAGYVKPTPIQEQAIPHVLARRDVLGIAQTGTGKTAAFVLPMLTKLEHGRARARMPRTLILEPTRELAAQVEESFEKYGVNHKLNVALLIGGVSYDDQDSKLVRGVDVLIATPGRLLDHCERGRLLMSGVELLVIDEADRMLDMGFIPDIERICKLVPFTRQTLRRLIRASVGLKNAIVFCNRKREVATLHRSLVRHGFSAIALHGDMDQQARTAALEQFRKNEVTMLVASDVAARGLDIPDVSHVFNFDVPHHPDDYVHRIGRTGRAGRSGTAVTIVAPGDHRAVASIEKLIGQSIPWSGNPVAEQEEAPSDRRRHNGRSSPLPRGRKAASSPGREEKVTAIGNIRPRRAPNPPPRPRDEAADLGHFPAFLLRPIRVKA